MRARGRSALTALVVVAVTLGAAFLLNPSPERHRDAIKQAIGERSPIAGALGLGALTALTSSYRTLGVASYTVVNERVVSIGAFGFVHVGNR